MKELKFLEEQGVSSSLINKIVKFREVYPVSDEVKNRIIKPAIPFYGKDILEMVSTFGVNKYIVMNADGMEVVRFVK